MRVSTRNNSIVKSTRLVVSRPLTCGQIRVPQNQASFVRLPSPISPTPSSIVARSASESSAVTSSMQAKPHVALLGTGLMGDKMAKRLRELNFPVTVWNRSADKAKALESCGCTVASSAGAAVAAADVVLTMLADAAAIESVLIKDPATKAALKGKTVVQMSTIGPAQAKEIGAQCEAAGASFLEAPVLGSQPEALAGTLLIMVGCEGDMTQSKAYPVLQAFGKKISWMGEVGTAAASKLALNQMISALTIGFSTSLAMVKKNDVDLDTWMGILRDSALYASTYDKKLDKYNSRQYGVANFPTKHLLKDVRLFGEEAEKAGCETGFLKSMEAICAEAVSRGFENADYSAVYEAVLKPKKSA